MRFACLAVAVSTLALAPACTIEWGDEDDIYCPANAEEAADRIPAPGLLNPANLQCEYFDSGGGCDSGSLAEDEAFAVPSWASCDASCFGFDESTCISTAGCRTAYDHACLLTDGPCAALVPFIGCYPVDTSGPIQGACEGLDAFACSQHDDCLATYTESGGVRQFTLCMPELTPECGDCG